jgi:hypothetical protein
MDQQWGVTEDDIGRTHVLPIFPCSGFKTKREAQAFAKRLNDDEDAISYTDDAEDDSGLIRAVSFGHQLSVNCPCKPEKKDRQIVHNVIQ